MGPLQGWGPTFWSPAPKAVALNLALYLLLLLSLHCALETPSCREEEYPVGAECCPKCSPGFRVKEACGEFKGTKCVPCSPGTYTAHLNGLEKCLLCRVCDPDMGLVTRHRCSSTANTVCSCAQGHFCVHHDGDDCAECRSHSVCGPGQRVRGTGTESQDTVCEDCLPGTFSPGGTVEVCQPWTRCSGPLEMEVNPGTNSTDVTCSSRRHLLFLGFIPVVVCVITGVGITTLRGRCTQKRFCPQRERPREAEDTAATQALPICRVLPDVTTDPVEETAPVFHEKV